MNPLTQFEESARTIWRSNLGADEKRKRLNSVRCAIAHYLDRLDTVREKEATDVWRVRAFERARRYLVRLAADVEELALECERREAAPRVSPYMA